VQTTKSSLAALTLGALGVVYGDIGTSPLYAFKEVFASGHVPINEANVLGVLSMFFWALMVVVSLKYVVLIMRADNHGEGGLMALLALASQSVRDKPKLRSVLLMFGVFGVALFFGDGVITPAISVCPPLKVWKSFRLQVSRLLFPFRWPYCLGYFWFRGGEQAILANSLVPLLFCGSWYLRLLVLLKFINTPQF
jgi:K+ transporter